MWQEIQSKRDLDVMTGELKHLRRGFSFTDKS